jgi:hypothetical protein
MDRINRINIAFAAPADLRWRSYRCHRVDLVFLAEAGEPRTPPAFPKPARQQWTELTGLTK